MLRPTRRLASTRSALLLRRNGPSSVLRGALAPIARPPPAAGQVEVAVRRVGVNMHDTYVRSGLYPTARFPAVMGCEAAGRVTAVGAGVRGLRRGDRVALFEYASAYATHALVAADACFKVPDGVSDDLAAATLVQVSPSSNHEL